MLSDAAEGSPSRPSDNTLGCTDEVAAAAAVEAMAINAGGAEDLLLEIAEGSAGKVCRVGSPTHTTSRLDCRCTQ